MVKQVQNLDQNRNRNLDQDHVPYHQHHLVVQLMHQNGIVNQVIVYIYHHLIHVHLDVILKKIFAKFGTINEVWMATNPPCFAFVNFKHRADAEDAMEALDGKMIDNSRVGISFARKRTIGGRRGGSYNNGGDRHSRGGGYDSSRYRRYSPRQGGDRRRRYSRSRSPVQTNKRDYRQRSRSKSSSPKTRRNRPSSRERSPQQQAVNVVHRYSDNDDRSE